MGDLIFGVLFLGVLMAIGYKVAKDKNRNPIIGLALGALIAFFGIGAICLYRLKSKKSGE